MIRYLLLALILASLWGCGTQNVQRDFKLERGNPNGVVVGSLTRAISMSGYGGFSAAVSGMSLYYRSLDGGAKGHVEMDAAGLGPFYQGDFEGATGKLFVLELPPGDYEFYAWRAAQGSYASVGSPIPQPIRFQVKPAKASYIGNINVELIYGRNVFGVGLAVGAKVAVMDKHQRDLGQLAASYPGIAKGKVAVDVARQDAPTAQPAHRDMMVVPPLRTF